jgi:hypothetical protein
MCPAAKAQKSPEFQVLVDQVPPAAVRSELEIHYDVCGLASGTSYRGRLVLSPRASAKKGAAKPKPLVVTFQDKVEGPATRRTQELKLGSTKPGAYSLELRVVDSRGRERKRAQQVVIKNQ